MRHNRNAGETKFVENTQEIVAKCRTSDKLAVDGITKSSRINNNELEVIPPCHDLVEPTGMIPAYSMQ
ncbi:hypothetical protein AWV79_27060 [Cupriavidus sp. UYMMa02A]|nr:hypothetical protein AWV79_27060 [Cupriavidus sp. UYMMa02A]